MLGLTSAEARRLLEAMPSLVSEQPATLAKRMQLLNASLGVSGARLRTLIAQKPALLSSSASQMELRRWGREGGVGAAECNRLAWR